LVAGRLAKTNATPACLDGALHIWRTASNLARPDKSNETAHRKGTETTCIAFSPDSTRLVTRGADETVKRELGDRELN
jgi:WD40 repeat protein